MNNYDTVFSPLVRQPCLSVVKWCLYDIMELPFYLSELYSHMGSSLSFSTLWQPGVYTHRYELREDRKRETARAYGQMDSIKKDILRLLKQSGRVGSRGRDAEGGGTAGPASGNPVVVTTPAAPCPACSQTQGITWQGKDL